MCQVWVNTKWKPYAEKGNDVCYENLGLNSFYYFLYLLVCFFQVGFTNAYMDVYPSCSHGFDNVYKEKDTYAIKDDLGGI